MEVQQGTGYNLEIDTVTALTADSGTEANYKLVACLTANGFDGSTAAQTTTNKCSDGNQTSQPGELSWTMNVEGQVVTLDSGEATTRENSLTLKNLWKNKTTFWARSTNATNEEVGYNEGKVWISAYSENAPVNDVYTFTATLQGTGEPLFEAPTT